MIFWKLLDVPCSDIRLLADQSDSLQNIFVKAKPPESPRWGVKIGDFGISKRVQNNATALRTRAGTDGFQAPEILGYVDEDKESSEYSKAVDIWSLGCVLYYVAAKRVPFSEGDQTNSYRPKHIRSYCEKRTKLPEELLHDKLSPNGIDILKSLLEPEPSKRMTAEEAQDHSWFQVVSLSSQQAAITPHAGNDESTRGILSLGSTTVPTEQLQECDTIYKTPPPDSMASSNKVAERQVQNHGMTPNMLGLDRTTESAELADEIPLIQDVLETGLSPLNLDNSDDPLRGGKLKVIESATPGERQ